jgi:quercetin dioxygenase-like cupin family protein
MSIESPQRRLKIGFAAFSIPVALFAVIAVGQQQQEPQEQPQQGRTVTGEARFVDASDKRFARLVFEPGARTHWHKHTDRQLLLIEEGVGLVQERGEPVRVLRPGEPYLTKADVWHWHGAVVDEKAVQLTFYGGTIEWGEEVSEADYRAYEK